MTSEFAPEIIASADKVARQAETSSGVEKQAALELFKNAYAAIPNGGQMHAAIQNVRYLDGSSVNEITIDSQSQVIVDERGKSAHCDLAKGKDQKASLQETFECMYAAHGGTVSETMALNTGTGIKMNSFSSDGVLLGHNFGQSEYNSSTVYEAAPNLTLVNEQDGGNESLTIKLKQADGNIEQIHFTRESWSDKTVPVTLQSIDIVNKDGKILSTKKPELNFETQ